MLSRRLKLIFFQEYKTNTGVFYFTKRDAFEKNEENIFVSFQAGLFQAINECPTIYQSD